MKPKGNEPNWKNHSTDLGRSPATRLPVEASLSATEQADVHRKSLTQVINTEEKRKSEEKRGRKPMKRHWPPMSRDDGGSRRPEVQRTPGSPAMTSRQP